MEDVFFSDDLDIGAPLTALDNVVFLGIGVVCRAVRVGTFDLFSSPATVVLFECVSESAISSASMNTVEIHKLLVTASS